jgi:hypothetical protein
MHRLFPAVIVAAMLTACADTSTEPHSNSVSPGQPSLSVALPGTSVSLNSISCNLISSSTGEVRCSWDISNPEQIPLNIYPEAHLLIDYQCVSPNTGKIRSSGTSSRWTSLYYPGVTEANPSGSNVQLSSVVLPNGNTGRSAKYNTCKGNQTLVIQNYAMDYFDVYADNGYVNQPSGEFAWACLGTDDRYLCAVID